ncbi:MAG TPA: hypothetical protein VIY49_07950 [Bryobacteraceae bacterium]
MSRLRQLKLLYGVASAVWLGYIAIKLFAGPSVDHNPNPSAAIYCFLLLGGIPALGYILLFMVLPWVGRSFRRA